MALAGPNLAEAAAAAAATISKYELADPGDLVLAAFSGGADSAALFFVLRQLGYRMALGHVDHAMREGSAADAERCRAAAAGWGVPIQVVRLSEPPATEALARRARYQALNAMAAANGANRIATGHTLDDQAETVKMRLDRGGFGLGIPFKRGHIIRPLLQLRRSATEAVCREQGYAWLTDPTNADLRYTRNRIRRELQQAGDETILNLARIANASRAEAEAITRAALDVSPQAVTTEDDLVFIDRSIAAHAQAAAVVRSVLFKMEIEPSSRLIQDILTKVFPVTGSRLNLPGGLAAWAEPDHLVIGDPTPVGYLPETALQNPGVTHCPEWGLQVEVEHQATAKFTRDGNEEFFDQASLNGPLKIRQWQPGDRFQPLGMQGEKKLQDYFVDAKVPRRSRDRIPILLCGDRIAWVAGHRIDDRFKVTDSSRPAVRIKIKEV